MSVALESFKASLASSLRAIAKWRQEGNSDMESMCVDGAIEAHLHISLVKLESADAGISYLRGAGVRELLLRSVELHSDSRARILIEGSAAKDSDRVHVAWLVDEPNAANPLIELLRSPAVLEANGKGAIAKFWNEYNSSLEALAKGMPFVPQFGKLAGIQKHWALYPTLISAITKREGVSESLAEVHSSFLERHRDKRLFMTLEDGHPNHPVKWDFREASILRFATRANLL